MATQKDGKASKGCEIERKRFLATAKPITLQGEHNGTPVYLTLAPREFSSGSFGWGFNGPLQITVDGTSLKVQTGVNAVVAHSAEAK